MPGEPKPEWTLASQAGAVREGIFLNHAGGRGWGGGCSGEEWGKSSQGREMLGARASGRDSQACAGTGNHEAEGVAAGGLREVTGWVSCLPKVPLSTRAPGLSSWGRRLPPPAAGWGSPWTPASDGPGV